MVSAPQYVFSCLLGILFSSVVLGQSSMGHSSILGDDGGFSAKRTYGQWLCQKPPFKCHKVKRKESWSSLFPDEMTRRWVKRLNRMNVFLSKGMVIAIPKDLTALDEWSFSPFPRTIHARARKLILVDLSHLAFGAYDERGHLRRWGAISPGSVYCIGGGRCQTPTGRFSVVSKGDRLCRSKQYPKTLDGSVGGGEMSYCMFFYKGYALHGSEDLPGYPASQGCIRLTEDDAAFLNQQFVTLKPRATDVWIINDSLLSQATGGRMKRPNAVGKGKGSVVKGVFSEAL